MAVDLDQKKLSLCEALKDKTPHYWDLMKSWYKQKITKDDFDKKARSLLGESDIHLHNDFLFSLLIKCHTVSSLHGDHVSPQQYSTAMHGATGRAGEDKGLKRPKLDPTPITNITPYGVFNETRYLTGEQHHTAMMCGKDLDRILMCSHELLLPDLPTLHTRLLLIAWEYGLDGATEDTALYLIKALEVFLKSVLEACIMCKTHRKITSDAVSGAGSAIDSRDTADNLINTTNRVLAIETLEAQQTANIPNSQFQTSSAITSYNLRDAIKTYGSSCIPSFPVRAMIMERVLATLWHPNVSDLSNTDCIKQWKRNLMK